MQQGKRHLIGKKGEQFASSYLKKSGYKIIQHNFNARYGEIDIIALDGETLVFVEVKTRFTTEFGTPFEAITPWKLKTLIKTAEFYKLTHRNLPDSMRIDAVSVLLSPGGEVKEIELMRNISG